jgi:phage baseplate assembly protein W
MFTNSFAYPNLFNAATGNCDLKEDYASIVNRVGLLIQSYKQEEFMFPNYGSYFPDILLSYNTATIIEKAKENIINAISEFEPYVDSRQIKITDQSEGNHVKLQVVLVLDKNYEEIAGTIEWSWDETQGGQVK